MFSYQEAYVILFQKSVPSVHSLNELKRVSFKDNCIPFLKAFGDTLTILLVFLSVNSYTAGFVF